MPTDHRADFIVIGGGIAGASVAYWLAPRASVILLEGEAQPGYHATGRSAAMFMESYGTPQIRALTRASRAFFEAAPREFFEHAILTPRGALFVADEQQQGLLEAHWDVLRSFSRLARRVGKDDACSMVPVLRRERVLGTVFEPEAADMDVHGLHQGYLRGMRAAGGRLVCNAQVTSLKRSALSWCVGVGETEFQAPVVINAAGAWVDEVASLGGLPALGIEPRRRSALTFTPSIATEFRRWPLVMGAGEDWYFKPDAGVLLGSCANADPVEPGDVQPEELDIALAVDRIEAMTFLTIRRPDRAWAGLRSFLADGELVGGFDPVAPGFFWLAGQGGYGIQTSAAMGEACAALALGRALPQRIADFGLDAGMLSPSRLRNLSLTIGT
jgi:D-arginine dehydrogenase